MVDVLGHLAFGLLFALPVWFVWIQRVSLTFVGLVLVTALLPDIDVWLQTLFPQFVHHHGVTHTLVFTVGASLVGAVLVSAVLTRPVDRWIDGEWFDRSSTFAFAFAAFLVGGLSHLFADSLSAPDIAQPIEPFWPVVDKPFSIDVLWYNDPVWNIGLLIVAVILHVALAATVSPARHRFRWRET